MRHLVLLAIALCVGSPISAVPPKLESPPAVVENPAPPKKLVKALRSGDGLTRETAYKVSSISQEYELLRYLGLRPTKQSLVVLKKPYDLMTAPDPVTGKERQIWFDISAFYGGY